jgi:hypothetical protein
LKLFPYTLEKYSISNFFMSCSLVLERKAFLKIHPESKLELF